MNKNIKFIKIKNDDIKAVKELSELATKIIREHFDPIIGEEQNTYMINMFQSVTAITEQIEHGYQYFIVHEGHHDNVGFLAFYKRNNELYLSKFYLLKEQRGKGIATEMLDFIKQQAEKINADCITLNVNKENDAIAAYEHMGFYRIGEEQNDIGNGFVMDGYVYKLDLINNKVEGN